MEAGQGEQENSGKKKSQSVVVTQTQSKQDVTAPLKKVPSHVANTDKNYGITEVIKVNKKPELLGQPVYN